MSTELEIRLAAVLRDHPEIVVAYLFGSRARGAPRKDSDVDVAVIFDAGTDAEARFQLRCRLSTSLASAAGVHRADIVDFEAAAPLLAHEIIRDGRLLFSRDEERRVRVVARQAMRYIDTGPMRRTLDEATSRRLWRAGLVVSREVTAVAEEGLGSPEDADDVFACLETAGAVAAPIYERIRSLGGFRNILVHDYLAVDHAIVHRLLGRLDDLVSLGRTLDDYVQRSSRDQSRN